VIAPGLAGPGISPLVLEHVEAAKRAEKRGALDDALAEYERAFYLLPLGADAALAAELLRGIGHVRRQRGEIELALEAYEASLEIARAAALQDGAASALNAIAQNLGTLAESEGDERGAIEAYEAAADSFAAAGDELHTILALNNLGLARLNAGDVNGAGASFDAAYRLAELDRDAELLGRVELNRARLHIGTGLLALARDCCDRAFEHFSAAGSRLRIGETLQVYGRLFSAMHHVALAEEHFARAAEIADACGFRLLGADVCVDRARILTVQDRIFDALRQLNRAHLLYHELHARRELVDLDRRLDGLAVDYRNALRIWAESVEANDRFTGGHCDRVAELTCAIARKLGFEAHDIAWIRIGAYVHDVGKVNIPAALLNKRGPLEPGEREIVRRHSADGDAILAALDLPFPIRPMVRSHHERVDGLGYPDGLSADEIPLTARILRVADSYDALTSHRPWRPAFEPEEALDIMERAVGADFDPAVFIAFLDVLSPTEPARP
jgi:putative nucleotidyltransferase with HDIG domain